MFGFRPAFGDRKVLHLYVASINSPLKSSTQCPSTQTRWDRLNTGPNKKYIKGPSVKHI